MKTVSTLMLSLFGLIGASYALADNDFTPPPPPVNANPHQHNIPPMQYSPAPSNVQVHPYVNPTSNQPPGSNGGGVVVTIPLPGGNPPKSGGDPPKPRK